jgi:parallel beta helix pectate lyase-like protein
VQGKVRMAVWAGLALGVAWADPGTALEVDAPLLFDGAAYDDSPADGSFDLLFTDGATADSRIQNEGTASETEERIILAFDLRGLPAELSVVGASLVLAEGIDDGPPLGLYGAEGDGVASTGDAEISQLVSGPNGNFGDGAANTATLDVTDLLRQLHDADASFATFALRGGDVAPGDPSIHYRITTAEGGTAPSLHLTLEKLPKSPLRVSNHGIDSPTCGSKAAPCRSISQAIRNASAGDTILVGPGYYGDLDRDGTLGDPGEEPFEGNEGGCECMVHVNKAVSIRSRDGAASTLIDAGGLAVAAVRIDVAGAELGRRNAGFSITGGGPSALGAAVAVEPGGTDVSFAGNVVVGSGSGVAWLGDRGRISDNRAIDNEVGFQISGSGTLFERNAALANGTGVVATGLADFTLRGNVSNGNALFGFFLSGPALRLEQCSAIGNGEAGILIDDPGVAVERCNLAGNSRLALSTDPNCGLLNLSTQGARIVGSFFGSAAGPGADPADAVCDAGGATSAVEGVATKPIAVPLRPIR